MEGRGKSRRRNPYQTWKRRASAMLAVLLTLSLVLGDISGLSRTVMAGQRSVKEEFRIHREAILKAAEEAIEKGEPLSQPLAIASDEEKTETKYQELLPADGTVYEIFPETEQVQEVDSLELRVFIRLEEGADPASYTLTGEEELIFLYVNGGGVTAEGRVNIDGYVSDFIEVEPLEEEDDAAWTAGSGNAGSGNTGSGNTGSGNVGGSGSAVGAGSENGNGSVDESGNAAGTENDNGDDENAGNNDGSGTMSPEDSAADLTQSADEEEADDKTTDSESSQKPEDTLPAETEETEEAEETEADKKEDAGKPEKNPAESGADTSAETGDKTEEKETAGSTDEDGSADKDAADKDVTEDTEKEEDTDNSEKEDGTKAAGDGSEDKDEDKNTSVSNDDQDENTSDDGAADTNDAEDADEKDDTGNAVTVSLRQIQRVATSLASDSDAEKETTGSNENGSNGSESNGTGSTGTEGTGSGSSGVGSGNSGNASAGSGNTGTGNKNTSNNSDDDEDSYYENTGDPFDAEDAAALEDEEAGFKKVKKLDSTRYDEAVLDEVLAIRAFVVNMKDAGFDKEELLEGAHHLTYTVSEGEARVVYNPEYVRDEAVVTFGIIPAEGMEVYQVTANGETLAETEKTAAIASASEAKRASSSEADVDEERAVYYQIPQVLEDQDVQIQVVEEGYNSHPAFLQSRTVNDVTVTVSAEEGVLPIGTKLSVEEVTEQVADAVAKKVEAEASEDEPVSVTSVLAYDITLWDAEGNLLDNSWSASGKVKVEFSGKEIEERCEAADRIEIAHLETESDVQREAITHLDVDNLEQVADAVEVVGGESVPTIGFEAEHFSTYTIVFSNEDNRSVDITIEDMQGNPIGKDGEYRLRSNDNGPVDVNTIANEILSENTELQTQGYTFAKATAQSYGTEKNFTALRYGRNANYESRRVQVKIENQWQSASNYELTIYFTKTVTGTVTVSGNGSVEVLVNGESRGTATEVSPLTEVALPEYGPYTLKFNPDEGYAVGAITVETTSGMTSIPLDNIGENNECQISGIAGNQGIRVFFSELIKPQLAWKRSDSQQDNEQNSSSYSDSDIYVQQSKSLDFNWSTLSKLNADIANPWDQGSYYGGYAGNFRDRNFATWRKVGVANWGKETYELRRFQTSFTIPKGYSASDYIRLKTVGTEAYLDYNDGNIVPINDDIFIFVYKKGEAITNSNFANYLAFWTGTSNQDGLTRYQGVLGTEAEHLSKDSVPFPYTDGWYCEAELDNIGANLFKNYANAKEGDEFILDVFVGEYAVGGGMDELILEFVKSSGYSVTINYYKDSIADANFLGTEGLKGLALGERIDLKTYEEGKYINLHKPSTGTYEDGVQLEAPYIVTGENGVINVLYTTQTTNVRVEYYAGDTLESAVASENMVGVLNDQKLPLGITYANAVNTEYGKTDAATPGISLEERDWYSAGYVLSGDTVITEETTVIQVVYTRKYGSFPILKELQDYTGDRSGISKIRFQMYEAAFGESGSWVRGNAYGAPITLKQLEDNSKGLAEINHLKGGYYILQEIASADGYNLLTEDIRIQITLDDNKEVVWKVFDEHGAELSKGNQTGSGMVKLEESEDGEGLCLKVINTLGAELPETGGPGLIMMERFGWMLLLLAMAGIEVQIFSRRRRKEQ